MAYPVTLKTWLSKKHRTRLKLARKWRRVRRTLSAACGSYRRPYTRPPIGEEQRRAVTTNAKKSGERHALLRKAAPTAVDVFTAAAQLAGRAISAAASARRGAGSDQPTGPSIPGL